MKSKYGGMVMVGILALFIGLIIAIQITTTQGSDIGGLIPWAKAKGYEVELKKVRTEKEAAVQELIDLKDRMEQIEKEKADEDVFVKSIMDDQEKYKMAAGMTDVKGPGVVITVDDPEPMGIGENESILMYSDKEFLLRLVNRLRDGGAEAISVNEQRLIFSSEISLAGSNVNINAVPTAPPYTIKAIGNADIIESAITMRYGIVEEMRNWGVKVDIARQEEVTIRKYDGVMKFRYAKSVELDQVAN